jgi:hypothetical protein
VVLFEAGAGIQRQALVKVRVAKGGPLSVDLNARRSELAAVQCNVPQLRLIGLYVECGKAFDAARCKTEVELELLLQQGERAARRGVVHYVGELVGRHVRRRRRSCFRDYGGRVAVEVCGGC